MLDLGVPFGPTPAPAGAFALARDFGSVDGWRSEFVAMARGLAGGSGWVLLVYVPRDRRLINQYAGDHGQTTAGGIPVLALDMYEHAHHIDFGAKKEFRTGSEACRNPTRSWCFARTDSTSDARRPSPRTRPDSIPGT
jgi:hypothetical protein